MSDADNRLRVADQVRPTRRRSATGRWLGAAVLFAAAGGGWFAYSHQGGGEAVPATPPAPPQVVVSRALAQNVETQLGFLGQFAAVDQVELRAQVGGTLTEIRFKDGDIVRKGDLLFEIDPVPYEIRLAQANAQLATAAARMDLATRQFARATELKRSEAGTAENVDQRQSDRQAAQASIDAAKAQIRDAQFDLDHCRITAPFTGRIGTHLVSVGNLVAGSRAAASPTTLLATIVSTDPIYLNFDMSEADYLAFTRTRVGQKGALSDKVQIALSDETEFGGQGTLDFVDNTLNRSSGTMHARATIANPDKLLTPGEFARVRLLLGAPVPSLLLPDAAVLPDQSGHVVLTVADDGTVVPKPVSTGALRDGLRVIQSGLSGSDRVIIGGIPFAAPGSKVTPQDGPITPVHAQSRN